LLKLEAQLEGLQREKEELVEQLAQSGRARDLLFEKGKPLESAIVDALTLLGFDAAPYKDGESEFDVVFEAAEGRLIGEAEGKDNKAINVDKLRQLAMNLHEDLLRDAVESPAKGVLFGNGYRLSPVQERQAPFTEKCISAASSSGTALVATSDLFQVVHYLANHSNDAYAAECRKTIVNGVGVVVFPEPVIDDPNAVDQLEGGD
jgi:hypothetical protein